MELGNLKNNNHISIEPIIIIDDDEEEEKESFPRISEEVLETINSMGPEVSIIPIKKPPKNFDNFQNKHEIFEKQSIAIPQSYKRTRENVKLVSPEEARTGELFLNYQRRKSLPLEKCPICKKYFRRMSTHLAKHQLMEQPNEQLVCNFCNKIFSSQNNLLIHVRSHTNQKPYVCEICNKGFAQSCNLVNHMRIHSGERPYKCPHCDRAFTQSGNLMNHIRLHTNEKPFRCHFCDKAFVQSGNLNSHIRNNHKFMNNIFGTQMQPSLGDAIVNMSGMVN